MPSVAGNEIPYSRPPLGPPPSQGSRTRLACTPRRWTRLGARTALGRAGCASLAGRSLSFRRPRGRGRRSALLNVGPRLAFLPFRNCLFFARRGENLPKTRRQKRPAEGFMPPRALAAPAASERSGTFRQAAETRVGAGIEAGVLPKGKTEAESARGRRTRAPWGGTSRAARQRREVSDDLDNARLPLVILSSGVQEGRPFHIYGDFAALRVSGGGVRDD
jgi:hypothetical protein